MAGKPNFGNKDDAKPIRPKKKAASPKRKVATKKEKDEIQPDLVSFMDENLSKGDEIPKRQVNFRIPMDQWKEINDIKGNSSIQTFFEKLTSFYLDQHRAQNAD